MKFVLHNETFDFCLLVVIEGTRAGALKAFHKLHHLPPPEVFNEDSSVLGTTFTNSMACCIYLRYKPNSSRRIATLAHEAFHAAKNVTRTAGANSEETVAYLIGWIVNQVLSKVRRK